MSNSLSRIVTIALIYGVSFIIIILSYLFFFPFECQTKHHATSLTLISLIFTLSWPSLWKGNGQSCPSLRQRPARGMAFRKLSILLVIFELEPIVSRDSFCAEELLSEFFWRTALWNFRHVLFYLMKWHHPFLFSATCCTFFYVCNSCQLSISSSKFYNV